MAPGAEDDERWLVVDGRRWRRTDPAIPEAELARLKSHLGRGRSAVRNARREPADDAATAAARHRVQLAKVGLGERGTPWWEQDAGERRARWESALDALDSLDAVDGPE